MARMTDAQQVKQYAKMVGLHVSGNNKTGIVVGIDNGAVSWAKTFASWGDAKKYFKSVMDDDTMPWSEQKAPRSRFKNPISHNAKKAKKLYESFTGHKAAHAETVHVTIPDTLTVVGPCVAIAYECTRDGETAQYQHEFKRKAAPLLCSSPDGSQLFLIGGNFQFKDTGINDN